MLKPAIAFFFALSTSAFAFDPVTYFSSSIADGRLGPVAQQSFCYQEPAEPLRGVRTASALRIASVTKLFTTLVALDKLGPNQYFKTTFTLAGDRLHIAGGLDPWFEGEKVLALIAELQARGITNLSSVTFDKNFNFEDFGREYHGNPTVESVRGSLMRYFSPRGVLAADILSRRRSALKEYEKAGVYIPLAERGIPTTSLTYSESNPLATAPRAQVFVHKSRPLYAILKAMNAFSNNRTARNLWNYVKLFEDPREILIRRGVPAKEFAIHNGSGLGTMVKKGRLDNTSTCRAVLAMLDGLAVVAAEKRTRIDAVVATGLELGHFDERFVGSTDAKAALLAKTGTLYHTSALAGWIKGRAPFKFAILNQSQNVDLARKRQDSFLTSWIKSSDFGPPTAWNNPSAKLIAMDGPFFGAGEMLQPLMPLDADTTNFDLP